MANNFNIALNNMTSCQSIFLKYRYNFEKIFNIPLRNFWDDWGFNFYNFEKYLGVSKENLLQSVQEEYGNEAKQMIETFIKIY